MLRITIDTNIFVSNLLSKAGTAASVLEYWRQRKFILVLSPAIINEIQKVLADRKLSVKYGINPEEISQLMLLLERDALIVPGELDVKVALIEDPDGEMFLACAVEGQVDYIVSGDHHLLNLGSFKDIPILSLRQFIEIIKNIQ